MWTTGMDVLIFLVLNLAFCYFCDKIRVDIYIERMLPGYVFIYLLGFLSYILSGVCLI